MKKKEKITQAHAKGDTSRKGTVFGYGVEVRAAGEVPIEANGKIYYPSWSRVDFKEGVGGVPKQIPTDPVRQIIDLHGSVSYQAAQALRWWMHAELGDVIMTRIRKHRIEYSLNAFDEGTIDEHSGPESEAQPAKDPEIWTHPSGDILKRYMSEIGVQSEFWTRMDDKVGSVDIKK